MTPWPAFAGVRWRPLKSSFSTTRTVVQPHLSNVLRRERNPGCLAGDVSEGISGFGGFHGESKVGTWLHRIAVNTFIQRRRKTLPESMDNLMLEQVQFSSREAMDLRPPKPEEVLEEKEGRTLLQNSIAKLPEKYRTVLVLRDLEDRSVKETAVILGISVPAVKARLHRARLFVQRELQKVVSYETGGRTPRKSCEMKKGETFAWMRRPVRQLASLTAVALLMVGFAGFPATPRATRVLPCLACTTISTTTIPFWSRRAR